MNKPLPTGQTAQPCKKLPPRVEAVRELEAEVVDLFTGCERALLMAEDLVDDFFSPLSEDVGKQNREDEIIFYFEQNRIRAQILHDVLFKVHTTVKVLNSELLKDAKEA